MRDVAADVAGDRARLDGQAGARDQARIAGDRLDAVLVAGASAASMRMSPLIVWTARRSTTPARAAMSPETVRSSSLTVPDGQQADVARCAVEIDGALDLLELDVAGDRLVALLAAQAAGVEVAADRAELDTRAPCGTSTTRSVPPPPPMRRPHLKVPMLTR